MGVLGDAFGWSSSPIYQGFDKNRNALGSAASGLIGATSFTQGAKGIANGLMSGNAFDQANQLREAELQKQKEAVNQTLAFLQESAPDLSPLVASGALTPFQALQQAAERKQQAQSQGQVKPIEINGQLVDPSTGQVIGDYRDPSAGPSLTGLPSSYQEYVLSIQDPKYADFRTNAPVPAKAPTEAERKAAALTTVTRKDAEILFGDGTPQKPGIFDALGNGWDQSKSFGAFGINPLAGTASSDFKVAKDAISNITQSYLYAMSGATAPPEEVRKIAEQVTPQPLDSPDQKKWKRERLLSMYAAIEGGQGNAAPSSSQNFVYNPSTGRLEPQ